jgi:hypothetical protein
VENSARVDRDHDSELNPGVLAAFLLATEEFNGLLAPEIALRAFAVLAYIRTAGQGLVLFAQLTEERASCKTMIQRVKMPL